MISNLKELRQATNLTQKELAEKTGVSQQKISELERNVPSYVEAIANICSAVGCTFEELFGTTAKLNRNPEPVAQPTTPDRCDTAALPPVQGNHSDQPSVLSDIFETFVETPVEKVARCDYATDPKYKSKKYYVQLKSIDECLSDPSCAADVNRRSVYGIKKECYEELAARPAKALCDGVRFYVADNQETFDFSGDYKDCGFWYVAPRFIKQVWVCPV